MAIEAAPLQTKVAGEVALSRTVRESVKVEVLDAPAQVVGDGLVERAKGAGCGDGGAADAAAQIDGGRSLIEARIEHRSIRCVVAEIAVEHGGAERSREHVERGALEISEEVAAHIDTALLASSNDGRIEIAHLTRESVLDGAIG